MWKYNVVDEGANERVVRTQKQVRVERYERWRALGNRGVTVWLTGLPGSGKSTLAYGVERELIRAGRPVYVLDADQMRWGINSDLGYSDEDRSESVRRLAEVAALMADAGLVVLVVATSPFVVQRERARKLHEMADVEFHEIFVDASVEVCAQRDTKGSHASGSPEASLVVLYEPPEFPQVRIATDELDPVQSVIAVMRYLRRHTGVATSRRRPPSG